GIAGFLATTVGTPNLLLVGALFIFAFATGIPFVWPEDAMAAVERERRSHVYRRDRVTASEVRRVFSNSHVRLIAASVLMIVVAKQLVDYQFNTLTEEIFGTEDAIAAFQGKVNLATQWLPLVSVVVLRPLLKRWGLGAIVFILPGLMFVSAATMALFFGIYTVIAVRTVDTTFRYSAERASREILYVPVPEDIKLKAKTYIDVGVEKGVGKAVAAGVVALLVEVLGFGLHGIAWIVVVLTAGWLAVTVLIRREYVRTLARSIRGRFASFQGLSALSDASTQAAVRKALGSHDPVQVSFGLDLVAQSAGTDTHPIADALHDLLDHDSQDIRLKALTILTDDPESMDPQRVRPRLEDPTHVVREQAVRALIALSPGQHTELIRALINSPNVEARAAALACLARSEIDVDGGEVLDDAYIEDRLSRAECGDRDARIELALAAGALPRHPRTPAILGELLQDPDHEVVSTALRSAGLLDRSELHPAMIAALQRSATRQAAREALAKQGGRAVEALARHLLDEGADPTVRRHIPSVLARVPHPKAVTVMLHSVVAPETDQLLDYRTLKALSQLRVRDPSLGFDTGMVMASLHREVEAAERYDRARRCLLRVGADGPAARLLTRSLDEAWDERQEGAFMLLGLIYPAEEIYRAYLALSSGDRSVRANAIEWIEETVDRELFEGLAPVIGEGHRDAPLPDPGRSVAPLLRDGDPWIARLAMATAAEIGAGWSRAALRDIMEAGPSPELRRYAARLLEPGKTERRSMDLIEKVFLLQKIDLLQDARSAHLALLASIAEEVEADEGVVLIRKGEPTDALYVVIEGVVDLEGVVDQQMEATEGSAFGTWALIDEAASLVTATVREPARLLRITRSEFYDLLADHSELALGLLQGLARRVRGLVA
ncbi:MAG: cyclic nucleotide-binding domain-containing protein, partial [Gemmatimonadota bacterium]